MRAKFCALAAIAVLGSAAAAAPPAARFYGLSSGNGSAFTASPNGSAISILFDNFKMERSADGPAPKHAAERNFTLAASPHARGCQATIALRGSALAVGTPRAGSIALSVGGHKMTMRPQEDEWTLTTVAALALRERTDVVIALDLPAPENNGSALLELDSVDVSLGKCRGRR